MAVTSSPANRSATSPSPPSSRTVLIRASSRSPSASAISGSGSSDSCDVFRLERDGYDYRAVRIAEDLDLSMAQGLAEDGARRIGLDAMTIREQAWRQDAPTDGQLRKL